MRSVILLLFGFFHCGCVAPQPMPAPPTGAGAMGGVWETSISKIRQLEARRAHRTEWRAAALFEDAVRTRSDLAAVADGLGLNDLDEVEAMARFQSSAFTAHYGFPANFHALVFFDRRGRTLRVMR